MGLLKFIGAVFLIIFGFIFLISTMPTLTIGALIGNLTGTVIITLIEAVVGIIMCASGLYIGVRELFHKENNTKTETVVTNKTDQEKTTQAIKDIQNTPEYKRNMRKARIISYIIIAGIVIFFFGIIVIISIQPV